MKKILVFSLCLLLMLSLAACTKSSATVDTNAKLDTTTESPALSGDTVQPETQEQKEAEEYAIYTSNALGITIKYPLSLQNMVSFSDGMSYEGFLADSADPINCVFLYPSIDSSYDQDSIIAEVYWIPSGTFGPEASFGSSATWFTTSDGSECVCHLPMSAKLGYEAVDCTIPNKQDLWNTYDTIEKSILNGEFCVEVL